MNELLGRFSFHSVEAEGRIEVHGQRTGSVATAEEIDELLIALNNASLEHETAPGSVEVNAAASRLRENTSKDTMNPDGSLKMDYVNDLAIVADAWLDEHSVEVDYFKLNDELIEEDRQHVPIAEPTCFARSFDEVVSEVLDMIHENVQFYDRLGQESNISVINELKPWIEQSLINCEKRHQ